MMPHYIVIHDALQMIYDANRVLIAHEPT